MREALGALLQNRVRSRNLRLTALRAKVLRLGKYSGTGGAASAEAGSVLRHQQTPVDKGVPGLIK